MKTFYILPLLCALVMVGCGRQTEEKNKTEYVDGDGNIISREFAIEDYHTIMADYNIEIHYKSDPGEPYLKITTDSNLMDIINPSVKDGVLNISREKANKQACTSRCVVETNSHQLRAAGVEEAYLGLMCRDLQTKDSFERHEKYARYSTSTCYEGELGLAMDVVKRGDEVTFDFVHDIITKEDGPVRTKAMSAHLTPCTFYAKTDLEEAMDDLGNVMNDLGEAMNDLGEAMNDLGEAMEETCEEKL